MIRKLAATGAALLLGACGGSSVGNLSFDELKNDLEVLVDVTEGEYIPTPEGNLPTGKASFTGLALVAQEDAVTEEAEFTALGTGRISIDIGAGTATGSAGGFFEIENPNDIDGDLSTEAALALINGAEIEGSFSMDMTQLVLSPGLFSGTATGALTKLDGSSFTVGDSAAGFVSGDNAERFYAVVGDAETIGLVIIADEN